MIKFVPVTYESLPAPFCDDSSNYGYVGYNVSDNYKNCGICVFCLNGYTMDIDYLEVTDSDDETAEGFIRSALNYGGNRNVYIANFKAQNGINVAQMLGFKEENGILSGDIPTLLKGSCCKEN